MGYKNKLHEIQSIISKMPLEACCIAVVPEFDLRWHDVGRMVRRSRLPMQPASVARVLVKYAAKHLLDVLDDLLGRLRLKLVPHQNRTWHAMRLLSPHEVESPASLIRTVAHEVSEALQGNMTPVVHSMVMGDLLYLSVQLVSKTREGSILYMCTPLGEPVALVTSVGAQRLMKACFKALGYKHFEDLQLHGKDIKSLLLISDPAYNRAEHLSTIPEYRPMPTILPDGIDYTNTKYDEEYVDTILGPNPPLLTDLTVNSNAKFFDTSLLDKRLNITMRIKSEDIGRCLKMWVGRGAIAPTSKLFHVFHEIKSNRICFNTGNSDSE